MENKITSLKSRIELNNELDNLKKLVFTFISSLPHPILLRKDIDIDDPLYLDLIEHSKENHGYFTFNYDVSNRYSAVELSDEDLFELLENTIPKSVDKIFSLFKSEFNKNDSYKEVIYEKLQLLINEINDIEVNKVHKAYQSYLIDILQCATKKDYTFDIKTDVIKRDFGAYLTSEGTRILPVLIERYRNAKPKRLALMIHCLQDFGLLSNKIETFSQEDLTEVIKIVFDIKNLKRQSLYYGINRYKSPDSTELTELKEEKIIIHEMTRGFKAKY